MWSPGTLPPWETLSDPREDAVAINFVCSHTTAEASQLALIFRRQKEQEMPLLRGHACDYYCLCPKDKDNAKKREDPILNNS